MTIARSLQIDLSTTRYYHCVSRCVRQMYLHGKDVLTGKDYSHRKGWILERIKFLTSLFAIDICAYAIMSNHTHLVLYVNLEEAASWSDEEIRFRWKSLFPADYENFFGLEGKELDPEEIDKKIRLWREKFASISYFMGRLNEAIAKMCNKEDGVIGRMWEGRFKSQALLDQGALLSSMMYVDLNPVRAGVTEIPEQSKFTSIYDRIQLINKTKKDESISSAQPSKNFPQPSHLMELNQNNESSILNFSLLDYLELTDTLGRIFKDKKANIPETQIPILERLQINPATWIDYISNLEKEFSFAIGSNENRTSFYKSKNRLLRNHKRSTNYYKAVA